MIWRRRDVLVSASAAAAGLLLVYYWLLTRDSSLHQLLSGTAGTLPYLPLFVGLLVLTVALFGANVGLLALGWRIRVRAGSQAGSILGAIAGGFGVGCPTCGAYLLSLIGVGSGLAALPFGGLEIWGFSALIMAGTLVRAHRVLIAATCDATTGICGELPRDSPRQTRFAILIALALAMLIGGLFATYR